MNLAHLNDVEDHVLVEAVQDALGDATVAPGAMNQQELLQVGKLRKRKEPRSGASTIQEIWSRNSLGKRVR